MDRRHCATPGRGRKELGESSSPGLGVVLSRRFFIHAQRIGDHSWSRRASSGSIPNAGQTKVKPILVRFAAFLVASELIAQGTFVVGAGGGPGVNFTDISQAVAAVADGSILLVRAGTYAPVTIDGKSVRVLCDSNVFVGGPTGGGALSLQISNIAAGQSVVVRGLRQIGAVSGMEVRNSAGRVVLDGMDSTYNGGAAFNFCEQVLVRNFQIIGTTNAFQSDVVFQSCSITAVNPSAYALGVFGGSVQAVQCSFRGGNGMVVPKFGQLPGGSGVQLFQASFRAMGRTIDVIAAGASPPGTASPIAGTGSARIDPAIPLLGGVPGVSNLSRPLSPSVVVSGGQLGGTINVARSGKQGIAFAVLASLPTASYTFPGVSDPVWIDATSGLVNMFGIAYGLGTVQVQYPVPQTLTLRGTEIHWQSVDFDMPSGMVVSNPSHCVLFL
ncbi:MAG: hypothetical protein ACK5BN_12050 [Planctomycetota bacterium]